MNKNSDEMRRPSTWLISMGVAFAKIATVIVADYESGATRLAVVYFWLWVQTLGAMLAGISVLYGLIVAILFLPRLADALARLRPAKADPPPPRDPPPQPTTYTRLVPGTKGGRPAITEVDDVRPARWSNWQYTALEVIAWYRQTGSLAYKKMAGRGLAFKQNKDAQTVYEEMDRVGLIILANGIETTLVDSLPSTLAAIRSGAIEWTDAADPPTIRPAPTRAAADPATAPQRSTTD